MKNNMALKWEKAQEKAKTKVEINFKKRWIPFLFEFAQKDLSKMDNLLPYLRAIAFLSSNPNQEFYLFDEDSFDSVWRRDFKESGYVSTDLGVVQAEVCKVLKYMGRKNLPDLSVPVILYHANIISGFYVNNSRGFLIESKGSPSSILHRSHATERPTR